MTRMHSKEWAQKCTGRALCNWAYGSATGRQRSVCNRGEGAWEKV